METSDSGKKLIQKWEGFKEKAYLCTGGVWTVGFGSTMVDGVKVTKNTTITKEKALIQFDKDVRSKEREVTQVLKTKVSQAQFDVLVSFVYNFGINRLLTSTLLRFIHAKNYEAAQEQFLRWNKSGGKPTKGLTLRRLDEALVFGPKNKKELLTSVELDVITRSHISET